MSDDEGTPQVETIHQGYHGWMKSIAKTSQDFTPVRIQSGTAQTPATTNGNSAWNAAGTWEERDKSEWARECLKETILKSFAFTNDTFHVAIKATSIVRCSGDAKIVMSRGKKRCGYDISLKFEWTSDRTEEDAEGIDQVTGHVEIHDFDDTTGEDYDIKITTEGASLHETDANKAVLAWEPSFRKLLSGWKHKLLEQ